jgi:hypothetical protein
MTASTSGRDGWSAQQARELFFANLRSLHIGPELERAVQQAEQERPGDRSRPRESGTPGRVGAPQRPAGR